MIVICEIVISFNLTHGHDDRSEWLHLSQISFIIFSTEIILVNKSFLSSSVYPSLSFICNTYFAVSKTSLSVLNKIYFKSSCQAFCIL